MKQIGMALALSVSCRHPPPLHSFFSSFAPNPSFSRHREETQLGCRKPGLNLSKSFSIRCTANPNSKNLRTCKNCKIQFDPLENHPHACKFHTAHFGGETKRKFESVYAGGTMDTPDSGKVFQYWHCCGSEDPFDPGCTAAPHSSYDD